MRHEVFTKTVTIPYRCFEANERVIPGPRAKGLYPGIYTVLAMLPPRDLDTPAIAHVRGMYGIFQVNADDLEPAANPGLIRALDQMRKTAEGDNRKSDANLILKAIGHIKACGEVWSPTEEQTPCETA